MKIPPVNSVSVLSQLPRLFKIGVLLSIGFLVIFILRLSILHTEYTNKQADNTITTPQNRPKTETQLLFETLIKNKQLITISADGRIQLPAKDFALARKVSGQGITEEEESLLDRLYYSIAGKAVQNQIKFWNHSRLFAAVRDNIHSRSKKTESRWIALNQWDEKPPSSDWVPLSYGYINGSRLQTGFNDWLSVADSQPIVFKTNVTTSRNQRIKIQIIGQPDISKLRGQKSLYACYPPTKKQRQQGREPGCRQVSAPNANTDAYVVITTLPAGTHALKLTVRPAMNTEKRIDGIPIFIDKNNQYAWESVREYQRNPVVSDDLHYSFKLMTHDGKSLINTLDVTPSRFAQDNGLVPLVGYEKSDRYALTGVLSGASLPHDKTDVHLTLDSRLQQLAQKNLEKEIPRLGKNALYARQRRAAVVLMKPQTGAILAAANYPNPPRGIHHWDRNSYSRLYPNRDPFGVNAWQGLDNHNAPGSTFKTVTALAAMQEVDKGRDDLKSMIKGLSPSQFQRLTGLPISSHSYQPDPETTSVVSNAGNVALSHSLPYSWKNKQGKTVFVRPPLRLGGGGDCGRALSSKNLGIREAVRDSLNVWFARLGVMMDENNLETGGKDTSLAAMARLLGFGEVLALAPNTLPLKRIIGGRGRGDVLNAFAGTLALDDRRLIKKEQRLLAENKIRQSTALQRLTQNSFGQGVATTPLQMARVAATIATGYIPQPYLISKWDNKEIKPAKTRRLKVSLIDYLRAGMKAVPEVGTARHAFNRYYREGRCRSYGKTGTAQLSGRGKTRATYNTAWFVGWHKDKKGVPDVSYACMVTHAYAKGKRSGGSVCAPIIARILSEMEKKPAKP